MKEDFTYSIEVKGTDSIQIPSLLTQPFLENSIHHGLLHKEGKKQLTVIYECSENSASCTIIDNGIGRSEALIIKERQKGSYTSFSLNAVNQRLRILSEQNNQSYSYEIEDLYDLAGNPSGTKIVVSFPFKHDY
jgi:LytS/YehU family sensor histidine kinase